jgi:diacylglycerol kinase (ATP)
MDFSDKNKALFILNPKAGVSSISSIVRKLAHYESKLIYFKSSDVEDSKNLIKQNIDKFDIFIAAGGDGTVHNLASELVDSNKILGVFPIGSGNGFAKEFGFKKNLTSLISDIYDAKFIDIDVIEINDLLCLNVAGIGLDSIVAHSFNKLKKRGFWSYARTTLKTFFKLHPFHANIKYSDNININEDLFVLTIANTRQFGNNAYIAPEAIPNDGFLNVVLIKPFPKFLFPIFVYRLFTGRLKDSKYVRQIKTDKEVTIQTNENRFHIDGEPLEINGNITIRIKRHALKVLKTTQTAYASSPGKSN